MSAPQELLMAVYNDVTRDGRVLRAAEALSTDWQVTVVSVRGATALGNKPFRSVEISLPNPRLLHAWRLFWFWMRLIAFAIRMRPAVFYVHDYYLPLPGLLVKWFVGCRCVYDAHELIVPEPQGEFPLRQRFFQFLESCFVRRADLVIAANADRSAAMRDHYRLARSPLVIRNIPPAPPVAELSDMMLSSMCRFPRLARRDRTRILYQGALIARRGLGHLIEAVALLPQDCELVVIGSGPDREMLQQAARDSEAADRILFLDSVPWDKLHGVMALADIGIVMYPSRGMNNLYCASNKIFEYAQAGLAIVATDQPPLRAAVKQYGIGVTVASKAAQMPAALAVAIAHVANDLSRFRAGLPRFLADHRWATEAERLVAGVASVSPVAASPARRAA
jgi:glycosyltransferase involved in cell wall biosynthesis